MDVGGWSRLNKNAQERGGSEGVQNLLFRAFRIHELLIHCIYSVYTLYIYTVYTLYILKESFIED